MNQIHLEGMYGMQPAKRASEIKVGDVLLWNYGYTSRVLEVTPSKTGKSVTVLLKNDTTGNINPRLMRSNRLVAFV